MTGQVVERTPRTPLASSVAPTGARTTPMPTPNQGAERRGRRWALRALVLGGLAGAAWLLTGTAAQAADHDPATETSSLIGAVVRGSTPVVHHVLKAAAKPLDESHPVTHSVVEVPARVLNRPVDILGTVTHGENVAPALNAAGHVVRDLTGNDRPADGAAVLPQLAPAPTPHIRTPNGVKDPAVDPTDGTETRRPSPAKTIVRDDNRPGRLSPGETSVVVANRKAEPALAAPVVNLVQPVGQHDIAATPAFAGTRNTMIGTERHAVTATAPDAVQDTTPGGGDLPASPQVQFGALSGSSTSASGAPTEGGSAAVLPAAVASGTVASHRLLRATDVEVRPYDAVAPTVSPD
ncbi:hypothetical protein [Actinoplanes sp. NPDC049265]|uniref:hypothetical protein n=1 Tax=Actinoplanes sp. NPDC049265 TaxID=3363902 RepID=UPI0037241AE9